MSSENTAAPADKRPWGLWASLVWYLIIFEGVERLFDYALNRTGLQASGREPHHVGLTTRCR
jgi:hypothetical protein